MKTSPSPILQDWFIIIAPDHLRLRGFVYGHPLQLDGKEVETSRLVNVAGRFATTSSGTIYRLGRVQPRYRRWLNEAGIFYDPKQPIIMRDDGGSTPP